MFEDWEASVRRQGQTLDRFIKTQFNPTPMSLLDCSCGIGTQAIGLALHGYKILATDLVPSAVDRVTTEAKRIRRPLPYWSGRHSQTGGPGGW